MLGVKESQFFSAIRASPLARNGEKWQDGFAPMGDDPVVGVVRPSRPVKRSPKMTAYVDVTTLEQLPPGTARVLALGATRVALFRVGDRVYAIDDTCLRCSASLASGALVETHVTCGCGWRYDVKTGSLDGLPGLCIDAFAVRIVASRVRVAKTSAPRSGRE